MAKPITISIPHSLGKDEAHHRIANGFDRLQKQIAGGMGGSLVTFQNRWEADRLHFEGTALGQKFTGRFDVQSDAVVAQIDLPEILAAIAEVIRGKLQTEGRKLLEKNR
jgi:hypothetical protein